MVLLLEIGRSDWPELSENLCARTSAFLAAAERIFTLRHHKPPPKKGLFIQVEVFPLLPKAKKKNIFEQILTSRILPLPALYYISRDTPARFIIII
jgi:hypothetical protein